jgi:hypothetical protein
MLLWRVSATYPTEFERCGKAKMCAVRFRLARRVIARQVEIVGQTGSVFGRRGDLRHDSPKPFRTGGKGIRTPDLLIANETLYQLSYTPQRRANYRGKTIFRQANLKM